MYSVVKRLHFCYGHRLMDYEGKCAHPHGHNALVEIELSSEALDPSGMVVDFGLIADSLADFIDSQLDHKMLLRRDDPLVQAMNDLGEDPYVMEVNPTAENIAELIFRKAREQFLPVVAVRLWETPTACAEYRENA